MSTQTQSKWNADLSFPRERYFCNSLIVLFIASKVTHKLLYEWYEQLPLATQSTTLSPFCVQSTFLPDKCSKLEDWSIDSGERKTLLELYGTDY